MARSDIDVDVTDEERGVMRECVREAFWYRSLPAAALTGDKIDHFCSKMIQNSFQD